MLRLQLFNLKLSISNCQTQPLFSQHFVLNPPFRSARLSTFTEKAASKKCNTPNEERAEAPKAAALSTPSFPPLCFSSILAPRPFSSFLLKGWLVSGTVYWQIVTFRIITMDLLSLCRVHNTTISMFWVQFRCFGLKMNPCVHKCVS